MDNRIGDNFFKLINILRNIRDVEVREANLKSEFPEAKIKIKNHEPLDVVEISYAPQNRLFTKNYTVRYRAQCRGKITRDFRIEFKGNKGNRFIAAQMCGEAKEIINQLNSNELLTSRLEDVDVEKLSISTRKRNEGTIEVSLQVLPGSSILLIS